MNKLETSEFADMICQRANEDLPALNNLLKVFISQRNIPSTATLKASDMHIMYKKIFSSGEKRGECSTQDRNFIFNIECKLEGAQVVVYIGYNFGSSESHEKVEFGIIQDGQAYIIE